MHKKKALILDNELDFCHLLCFYLSKKQIDCFYSHDVMDALKLIQLKRPELIFADQNILRDIEDLLHDVINSIPNYDPEVKVYKPNSQK
jgi:DNA-binding NtrC family response regulator